MVASLRALVMGEMMDIPFVPTWLLRKRQAKREAKTRSFAEERRRQIEALRKDNDVRYEEDRRSL